MAIRLIVFLSSANLICRTTDISKCFMESLGFFGWRDPYGVCHEKDIINKSAKIIVAAETLVSLRVLASGSGSFGPITFDFYVCKAW